MHAQLFKTQWGWGAVLYSSKGLKEIFLPKPFKAEIFQELPKGVVVVEDEPYPVGAGLKPAPTLQIVEYFSGKRSQFDIDLDLEELTQFQISVYRETIKIPYGQTMAYQELAKAVRLPQGARAVARALSQNPIPIVIPCHRVIQKDGKLGGFSGGVTWKSTLLDHERRNLANGGRNDETSSELSGCGARGG